MKPKARKEFSMNGIFYTAGDEVKVKNIDELIRLNERGFIDPMTMKDIQDYFKKPEVKEVKKIFKKEEE